MSTNTISFFCAGKPEPGGSKRAFVPKGWKRAIVTDANSKAKGWKEIVRIEAHRAYQGQPLIGPLQLDITFTVLRPKNHYGTGKNADKVKDSAPAFPTSKPDATKLTRSTEDALTGILWIDDAQIVCQHITKAYGDRQGALIEVSHYTEPLF